MAGGNETRRPFEFRDLNPHTSRPKDLTSALWRSRLGVKESFSSGAGSAGEIQVWTHIESLGVDRALVAPPSDKDARIVAARNTGAGSFGRGQKVTVAMTRSGVVIVGEPPAGDRGLSERPRTSAVIVGDPVQISEAFPASGPPGFSETVIFRGIGFRESPVDIVEAFTFNEATPPAGAWETDPLVTVGVVTWVSSEEISATVTVDGAHAEKVYFTFDARRG